MKMKYNRKFPHQLLFDIADGQPIDTPDGKIIPSLEERIKAAAAAAPYFAPKIIGQDAQKAEKYMEDVKTLLKDIVEHLNV